ncbi:MAG: ABC transporter permease [Candidatus Nanopelagicaceae bacterium]|nr:ABC transporter permease [Candidatus Nanopelagicaceae bacterium]
MKLINWMHRKEKVRLTALLLVPTFWLVVAYLGALFALLITSFFTINTFTGDVIAKFNLGNFQDLLTDIAYRNVVLRTLFVAISVTLLCVALAMPMAFYMAKIASNRSKKIFVSLVLTPLWASYLVKIYAWRTMLEPGAGVLDWFLAPLNLKSPGFGMFAVIIGLTYLWLPYMILPIYAGLDRLPNSLLDASSDLGAGNFFTLRKVVFPILVPSIIAGSMFTFSLSLGDYITVQIIGGKFQMLGNVVYQNFSLNLPFAATVSAVPIAIMFGYLWLIRKSGALSNL